jgi:hypothetical protein
MLRSLFGTNWRDSKAHLLLLSKFLKPRLPDDFSKSEEWKEALKESPQKAIERFLKDGMISEADLSQKLAHKFKVSELKNFLKQHNLTVSGRKEDLIARLVQADPDGMKKAVTGLVIYCCTEQGQAVAEQYLNDEKKRRSQAEQDVKKAIRERRFLEASQLVANFEAEQVFQRGVNIDWKNHNAQRDADILNNIFQNLPKTLSKINPESLEELQVIAGMLHLWGKSDEVRSLTNDVSTNLDFDNDSAVRLILSHALFLHEIASYKQIGVKAVRIYTCNDWLVCDECTELASKNYAVSEVPELPYEHCTCESGCRCWVGAAEFECH